MAVKNPEQELDQLVDKFDDLLVKETPADEFLQNIMQERVATVLSGAGFVGTVYRFYRTSAEETPPITVGRTVTGDVLTLQIHPKSGDGGVFVRQKRAQGLTDGFESAILGLYPCGRP
jgi:hypothetical protein